MRAESTRKAKESTAKHEPKATGEAAPKWTIETVGVLTVLGGRLGTVIDKIFTASAELPSGAAIEHVEQRLSTMKRKFDAAAKVEQARQIAQEAEAAQNTSLTTAINTLLARLYSPLA